METSMNEQIRELEKQATETVKCGLNGTSTAESFNRKKFAELIVKECVNVAVAKDSGYMHPANVAGYMAAGRSTAARLIKEHFGVEE
jgi:hypothetical protein